MQTIATKFVHCTILIAGQVSKQIYLKCKHKFTITLISVNQQSVCGTQRDLDKVPSYMFQYIIIRKTPQSQGAETLIRFPKVIRITESTLT